MGITSFGLIMLGASSLGKVSQNKDSILKLNSSQPRTEPEELPGTRISSLLAPSDNTIFKEATQRLQEDDSHTIEVRFKLQIVPSVEHDPSAATLYQLMEGKGMLIIDREDGQPSHTMWVIKPIAPARFEHDAETPSLIIPENDLAPEPASTIHSSFVDRFGFNTNEPATPFPFTQPISKKSILCRICECQIPQWYFEKHSETCVETHRLEAEVMECNESIAELKNTIRDLVIAVERVGASSSSSSSAAAAAAGATSSSSPAVPEYRGMQIFIPSSSPIVSSPLQLFRANKMQRLGVKKMQRRLLDQIDEILQVALEISMPSLKEEEANEPIERQRLLSPGSERKVTQIRQWAKPSSEDAALSQLILDAERIMRQKVDNVVRMQNTIRYAEKIWCEWQERVEGVLATVDESDVSGSSGESDGEGSGSGSRSGGEEVVVVEGKQEREGEGSGQDQEEDRSCGTSEYGGTAKQSEEPTPATSQAVIFLPTAPMPTTTATISRTPSVIRQQLQATRSSTPSSVSSPLALAEPIIAPSSPEEPVTPMLLDDSSSVPGSVSASLASLPPLPPLPPIPPLPPASAPQSQSHSQPVMMMMKSHMSASNLLEPKLVITPPASPQVSASLRGRERDGSGSGISVSLSREGSGKRMHRRHSTANSLTSPPLALASSGGSSLGSGPLSPRQSSSQPLPRTTPTSIKDFDIIKPISKGAFGSVFLAKKKATGDYYAIKVLKKADMIAKNQITNVKAERMILMKQAESPFVAKLYFTFQSRENLYLVMEYLNGGDCAALIKSLGCLPEEWTKGYVAEVVLGLDYLHQRGIVHRFVFFDF